MMKNNTSVNINTKHQCITVMKEYESKSLEELRLEDYAENRKGPQPGAAAGGLFAAPAPASTGGLFGTAAANKPLFGATTTTSGGLFGTQTSAAAPTLFGSTAGATPAAGGIFGAKPATSSFALPTSTAASTFAFGGPQPAATGGLFGTQPQAGKSLFGQPTTTTSTGLFGATATPAFGTSFGAKPAAQATGLFAQPAASTATSAFNFNTTQSTGTGLFGSKPATTAPFGATPSLFGTGAPTSTFGATATSGAGMFGGTALGQPVAAKPAFNFSLGGTTAGAAPAAGGLFGSTQPGGLFGSTATAAAKPFNFAPTAAGGLASTGSLFGGGATTNAFGGGLFGAGATTTTMAGSFFGSTGPALTTTVPANATISTASPFGGNDADVAQIMMLVNAYPYGDSPLFKNLPSKASDPSAREQLLKPTSASAQKALLSASNSGQKVNARSGSKLKPTPLLTMGNTKNQIFEGFEDDEMTWLKSISYTPRSSVKKLVLPKRGSTGRLPGRDSLEVSIGANGTGDGPPASALNLTDPSASPTDVGDFTLDETHAEVATSATDADKENGNGQIPPPPLDPAKNGNDANASTNGANLTNNGVSLNGTMVFEDSASDPEPLPSPSVPSHPAGIQLTRSEYYTIPSLEELCRMTDSEGICLVENLTIGREGYGSVFFPGETDLTGLNLDEIIFFRRQEVQVYVDEDNKPEVGSGINKPAEVTLDSVFPSDKTTREKITDPARLSLMGFSGRLEKSSVKMGAKFMEYRPETGSWVFAVKHFSKYGFDDSDDEDVPMAGVVGGKGAAGAKAPAPPVKAPAVIAATTAVPTSTAAVASQSPVTHLGGDAPSVVGLGGVDISAMAARGEALVNTSSGLGGVGRFDPADGGDEVSTPSQKLATHVGTDSSRVQLMKASFFGTANDEEEESMVTETESVISRPLVGSRLRRAPLTGVLNLPSPAKSLRLGKTVSASTAPQLEIVHDETADTPILENHPLLPSGLSEPSFEREAAGIRKIHPLVPEEESLTHNRQHLLLDAAFFMGRSFRVGWGPAWTLVHATSPSSSSEMNAISSTRLDSNAFATASFPVRISSLRVADHLTADAPGVAQTLEDSLKVQLEESEMVSAESELSCPEFRPKEGTELIHGQAQLVAASAENSHPEDVGVVKHSKQIWQLLVALYGHLPDSLCPTGTAIVPGTYEYHLARRYTFSSWLASNASHASDVDTATGISLVWAHLRAHRVAEAVTEAQKNGDYRLALIISQIGGSGVPKSIIRQQMADWAANGSDAFFQSDRLKIFAVAAGALPLQTSTELVNPCEDVDWVTALALHLWYVCSATSGVSDAINLYNMAFDGDGAYAPPPLPHYLVDKEDSLDALDTCFLLLQLFQDKSSVKLERLLAPISHTHLPLDSRVSWFLSQALRSLSYTHLSHCARAQLNLDFAALLESLGMWHWAIFVLQHNPSAAARDHAVKQMLQRYLALEEDPTVEQFLVDRLGLPMVWIHAAKAIRADHEKNRSLQAFHLLKCHSWNASHEVLLKHLAAKAIVNGKYDAIFDMLAEMNVPERSSAIYDWAIGGQILFDFIWLRRNLDADDDISKRGEMYGPQITSLCNRISNLRCVSSYDRLAQVEMSRHCSRYLKSLIKRRNPASGVDVVASILPSLSCLPLPENHAMNELNQLTRQFLLQIA